MIPDPLHPAVVHFPIVLAVLLPILCAAALLAIRTGTLRPTHAWLVPALLSIGLLASALVARQTGEAEEDRVERVVPEAAIHEHEEAAEWFVYTAVVVTIITLAGMLRGRAGGALRVAALIGSLVVAGAVIRTAFFGGALVWEHDAPAAYQGADPDNGDRRGRD
jgi:uncharacterized membrane protein